MSLGNGKREHWYLETEVSEQSHFVVSFGKAVLFVRDVPFWPSLVRAPDLVPLPAVQV